ncbi:MATE family efflux transporter [Enterococcus dispar]|uniref:MATE family efflux transporter n=2 Tax=Lactobacillales TaxID=186826 RepID=UPI0009DC2ADB|nr:MATE family efflux transporter [Enterococcus dispar]
MKSHKIKQTASPICSKQNPIKKDRRKRRGGFARSRRHKNGNRACLWVDVFFGAAFYFGASHQYSLQHCDRMYIGHIPEVGAYALKGLGISVPLLLIISAFSMLVGGGGAPLAAIALGRKDREEAERILGAGTFFLTVLGIFLPIIILNYSYF